jgi:N-sulfoglucosamine sulfohydrolase
VQVLNDAGRWDETLLVFISDNGVPFPGAKTTTYDAGLKLPCVVRNPLLAQRGLRCEAMISWVDIAPTLLEFAGAKHQGPGLHGRSFLSILDQPRPTGWDEVFASHTFHEVTMYYPMRVVRDRQYKLIWNVAHSLPFPFASDLWSSATWQAALAQGVESRYGERSVGQYVQRPRFELYDIQQDPGETRNLAGNASYAAKLAELQSKLSKFQEQTSDPWILKWKRE